MPFVPAPGVVQVNVVFQLFGQRVENVWEVVPTGTIDAPLLQDIADTFRTWVEDEYLPLISNDALFLLVEAKDVSEATGATAVSAPLAPVNGGSANASMPGGTSLAVSLRTALGGRSFRGRKYLFGLANSQVVGNQVGVSSANDFVGAINLLIGQLNTAGFPLVIVSRFANKVARTSAINTPVTVATLVDYNVDSQRRRLTGRGN